IMVAAPRSRIKEVIATIKKFDVEHPSTARLTPFQLKRANASRVSQQITSFYATRYPDENQAQNQIRVTFDDASNTVYVQAAPADLQEIAELIDLLDGLKPAGDRELRIVRLRYALPEEISQLILVAVSQALQRTASAAGLGTTPGLGTT